MAAESAGADPLIGRLIAGKFRVEKPLGAGAMGRVYLAEQTNLGKQVALKVLHAGMTGDASLEKRFHREARSASMLAHPNIVQMVDFGNEDGLLFIAMEFLTGRDLRRVIRDEFPFQPERVAHIVGQILGALDEAHAKSIIHRDLKPENVMITDVRGEPDFVKVCDFGIAKVASERDGDGSAITTAGMVCGTPEYMSPEQARGDPLDGRSDLYAVAVILYHMVAGELPFRAESALGVVTKHLIEDPVPPSKKRAGLSVPPGLEKLILRGMEKNRDKRPATASEMKSALYEAVGLPRPRSSTSSPQRAAANAQPIETATTGVATPSPVSAPSGAVYPPVNAWGAESGPLPSGTGAPRSSKTPVIIGAVVAVLGISAGGYLMMDHGKSPQPGPAPVVAPAPPVAAPAPPVAAPAPPVAAPAPPVAAPTPPVAAPTPPVAAPTPPVAAVAAGAHHEHHAAPHKKDPHGPAPVAASPALTATPAPAAAPRTSAVAFAEAEALFKNGDLNGAVAKYGEAARLNAGDARTQRQLGKCWLRLGQRERAQPYLRKYLELAPDASDAPFIRAALEEK